MALARWLLRHFGLDPDAGVARGDLFARSGNERLLLHVGCGSADLSRLPPGFQSGFREIRVDLDVAAQPDIVASFTDLAPVPDASVDALFCSHVIEHLYWFEVPQALAEARRVLREDGFVVITCPDLQAAAAMIAEDRLDETAYLSPAGPITPFDIVFSYRPFVLRSPQTMSHKCGFTLRTLTEAVRAAGFVACHGFRRPAAFDLWLLACPQPTAQERLRALASKFLASPD